MSSIARGLGVERLRAIGTSAVREASNRDEFIDLVRQRAELTIEPIDAAEEAAFAHASVAQAFDLRNQGVAVVDIGGGSTEVILGSGNAVEQVYSLPLGAVRLSEEFEATDQVTGDRFRDMRREVRRVLRKKIGEPPFAPQLVIGTGGTFTSLASISLSRASGGRQPGSLRGYEMKRSEIRHLLDWLRKLPLRTRARIAGLSPDRADIIVAGAVIVERLMKYLGVNRLQVHDGGVRDGLLRTMVRSLFPANGPVALEPPDPLRSVRQFAASCGYEERHCRHVAHLAGQILDQVSTLCPFVPEGWTGGNVHTLLEAAALLKDVGYVINYSKHHLHAYHLIVHSDLPGLNPREIQLIANIARYHRKSAPKKKHANFAVLTKAERDVVRRLAAILRIADGLDRTRLQTVRNIRLHVEGGVLHFLLEAVQEPAVELWGGARAGGQPERRVVARNLGGVLPPADRFPILSPLLHQRYTPPRTNGLWPVPMPAEC
jgi:exopolyphosphatase/guanosine-5'-triphosphate,3'-diphosphate pyrophosphatase